jgi:FKBP-type peptidyl-prolyl cis-trans isomerase FkpA
MFRMVLAILVLTPLTASARNPGGEKATLAAASPAAADKEKGKEFAEKAAKEPGAKKFPSGLVLRQLRPGAGQMPKESDTVRVNYEGKLVDGKVFDSSYKRNMPAQFPLKGVIKCWTEGLQKMKVGEKAQLVCPPDIAYGQRAVGGVIAPGSTLVFTVELLGIVPSR